MNDADVILQAETTTATRADAERLARAMVERRLAACAQIVGPIRSVYWWEGAVQDEEEHLVLFKTRDSLAGDGERSYDVPEILLFAAGDGERSYLEWVRGETAAHT